MSVLNRFIFVLGMASSLVFAELPEDVKKLKSEFQTVVVKQGFKAGVKGAGFFETGNIQLGVRLGIFGREELKPEHAKQGLENALKALSMTSSPIDFSAFEDIHFTATGLPKKDGKTLVIPCDLDPEALIPAFAKQTTQEPAYQKYLEKNTERFAPVARKLWKDNALAIQVAQQMACSGMWLIRPGQRFQRAGFTFTVVETSDFQDEMRVWFKSSSGEEYKASFEVRENPKRIEVIVGEGVPGVLYGTNYNYDALTATLSPDCTFLKAEENIYFFPDKDAWIQSSVHASKHTYNSHGELAASEIYRPEPLSVDKINRDLPETERAERVKESLRQDREIVTILDLGVDYNHKALAHKILRTPKGEMVGWDYDDNGPFPYDQRFSLMGAIITGESTEHHGSHVAGIAANHENIAILPIRHSMPFFTFIPKYFTAIKYAHDHGSRIVNISMGTKNESSLKGLIEAIRKYPDMLFVIAAGNDRKDLDTEKEKEYPAAYFDEPNVIVVASSDDKNAPSEFTNFGKKTVHLAAPGEKILSAWPGGGMMKASGTSMAAPAVSEIAAEMRLINPVLTGTDLKRLLLKSVEKTPEWEEKTSSGGYIKRLKAIYHARMSLNQSLRGAKPVERTHTKPQD